MLNIKTTLFQCDNTNQYYHYDEMYIVWYDITIHENGVSSTYYFDFKLVSITSGNEMPSKKVIKENQLCTLSKVKLKKVFEDMGNPTVLLSSFLYPDYHSDPSVIKYIVEPVSFQKIWRRLTIPNFEDVKDQLQRAKTMDYFNEFPLERLLYKANLAKFKKELSLS